MKRIDPLVNSNRIEPAGQGRHRPTPSPGMGSMTWLIGQSRLARLRLVQELGKVAAAIRAAAACANVYSNWIESMICWSSFAGLGPAPS